MPPTLHPAEIVDHGYFTRGHLAWAAERLAVGLVTAGCVVGLYYLTSHITSDRHLEFESSLDRAIPFIPETAWVYFPCYMLQFLLGVFGIRSRGAYYGAVRSILFSAAICLVIFLVAPSTMAWPPLPLEDSVTRDLLVVVRTLDVPNNTFPSLHVALSFCVALGALRFRRWFGLGLLLMSCVISMSTITAKHHYVVDSPGGLAVAALAHWLAFRVRRRESYAPALSPGTPSD